MSKPAFLLPGFFITLEGGEGAGKSTLLEHLEAYLVKRELQVVKSREPGGSVLGEQIRKWVLDHNKSLSIGPKAELLLFLAARSQHIDEVILPALKQGKVVLCDRFNDSSIAYQGAGRSLGLKWVKEFSAPIIESCYPDLTFYLDVDPKVGLERSKAMSKENAQAGSVDRIESETYAFHERLRNAFLTLAKDEKDRIFVIDANQRQEVVIREALKILETQLAHKYV